MFFSYVLANYIYQFSIKSTMVIESLVNPISAERRNWTMILIGFLYSSIGIFLALWVFKDHADLVTVFFTVMGCMPFFYFTVKRETDFSSKIDSEKRLLIQHAKAIKVLMYLFMGFVISFTFWYVILPASYSHILFGIQTSTIISINNPVTGNAVNEVESFMRILLNNVKVLTFCILFSFVYGLGAIFILTWNASILSVAIGNFIKTRLVSDSYSLFLIIPQAMLRYLLHGIPEMTSYFIGGLAGGIISVAVINYSVFSKSFEKSLYDASQLIVISLLVLMVAAMVEVFITPLFF
jgi:uncharacterized membrane protein SpoIIM required for sporulation